MKDRNWIRKLFRQRFYVAVLIVLQVAFLIYLIISRSRASQLFGIAMTVVSFFVALHITSRPRRTVYKVAWIYLILSFPLFGGMLYLLLNYQYTNRKVQTKLRNKEESMRWADLPGDGLEVAREQAAEHLHQVRYLQKCAGFPVYTDTTTRFLSPGEAALPVLLEELEKAERYIFLEFFILQEGRMWDSILDVLKRKAAEGVKVRIIYDDMGCFLRLPGNYPEMLKSFGIECTVFNPFRPLATVLQNNRDHRKIVVIDGKTALTGGMNLADEYINACEKCGYWKDCCVLIKGKAAWSFAVMFLEMWKGCRGVCEDIGSYYPADYCWPTISDGLVQPYADSPLDQEYVGEYVYLQLLHNAKEYVYINTPYLVVDDNMLTALSVAAKSGADVRIVTPHVWDKKFVHMTTRSYYKELLEAGVRIYEYTPGFMHAKTMVSDDKTATVGTINMDYRSLFLHFECGVWMYDSTAVMQVKEDFLKTLEECQEITCEDCRTGLFGALRNACLRLIAPLL